MEQDRFFSGLMEYSFQEGKDPRTGERVTPKLTVDCPRKYPANIVYEIAKVKRNCHVKLETLREARISNQMGSSAVRNVWDWKPVCVVQATDH
eukprot:655986-Amphidinium_carterae.1